MRKFQHRHQAKRKAKHASSRGQAADFLRKLDEARRDSAGHSSLADSMLSMKHIIAAETLARTSGHGT